MREIIDRAAVALNRFAVYPRGFPPQYYIYDFHASLDGGVSLEWRQPPQVKMVGLHDEAEAECARMNARAVIEVLCAASEDLPIPVLLAGKNSLFSCSEDPEIDDAQKCFLAMITALLRLKVTGEQT